MIAVRCPSCSASLKVNTDRLGARTSAKCPRCQAQVPLTPAQPAGRAASAGAPDTRAGATILVSCPACGSRLKAPAARAGSMSSCPKCHAQILIQPAAAPAVAAVGSAVMTATSGSEQEESSSAATRRIDSRMLGMFGPGGAQPPAGEVDLDAFIRPAAPPAPETPWTGGLPGAGGEPGLAASLMKPPVAAMGKIAEEIRETAEKLTEQVGPVEPPPRPARTEVSKTRGAGVAARAAHAHAHSHSQAREESGEKEESAGPTADIRQVSFSPGRGLFSGLLAGLMVGAASAGAAAAIPDAPPVLAPLPFPGELLGVPDIAVRVLLPGILGATAGFIAAALHSTRDPLRPAPVLRCAGVGLLMGAACGLVGGVATGTGMLVWPIANWMRDLLLVGLLTPAVNRIFPSSGA